MQFLPFALDIQADHNRTKHIYIDMGLKRGTLHKSRGVAAMQTLLSIAHKAIRKWNHSIGITLLKVK